MSVKKAPARIVSQLEESILELLVGQDEAVHEIVPYIEAHQADLCMPGRPIAVILLMGPSGVGKTASVEAIAKVLHGNPKSMIRIDCGEYQADHEVAKLIGAPPGYLGHRETAAILTQMALINVQSETSKISIVLFDEIEKGSHALERLLMGICDKAQLRTGDNVPVNFENTLLFFTSNLGEAEIQRAINPHAMGFTTSDTLTSDRYSKLGTRASKKNFSAAMINRIDLQLVYKPLADKDYEAILHRLMADWLQVVVSKHGARAFYANLTPAGRQHLLQEGISAEYGARHLKRALHQNFINPVCKLLLQQDIKPGATVTLDSKAGKFRILVKNS